MQDVHNILLYCNTDVVIIKPATGRARLRSASLKTTRKIISLGFHKEKGCQHSHSSDPVPVHIIRAICCNILLYTIYWYISQGKCIALCNIATYWYNFIVTALVTNGSSYIVHLCTLCVGYSVEQASCVYLSCVIFWDLRLCVARLSHGEESRVNCPYRKCSDTHHDGVGQ